MVLQNKSLVLALAVMTFGVSATPSQNQPDDAKPRKFEVASIRLIPTNDVVPLTGSPISPPGAGVFTMHEVTLAYAIAWAFKLDSNRVSGGPDWLNQQYYEISAKPEGEAGLTYPQLQPLVQELLCERFHLTYHREVQNLKGYALVVAKGGPKLMATKGGNGYGYIMRSRIRARNWTTSSLASSLERPLGQPVVDQTGLSGSYDIDLNFAPLDGTDSPLPSIFAALEEQLGLKLTSTVVPVEMLVIDHVERVPTEN